MKKKGFMGKAMFCLGAAAFFSLFVFGESSEASSLKGKNNEEKIFYYLQTEMGLNNAAGAGVLANIERESSFNPKAEGDGGTSYGICQWHGLRYEDLKRYCSREGSDYKSLEGQLDFLLSELETDSYYRSSVYNRLLGVKNSKKGAYNAGYSWCYYFEIPEDRESSAVSRGNLAKNTYWPRYKDMVYSLTEGETYKTDEGTFVATGKDTVSFSATKNKKVTELTIPDKVQIGSVSAKVTGIASGACKNRKKLKTVVIGKNVKTIGDNAFSGCKKLESVTIRSKKVSSIGENAFKKIKSSAVFYVNKKVKTKYKNLLKDKAPSGIKIKKL